MSDMQDLTWLHARDERLTLLAIEVDLRLESCRARLDPLEAASRTRRLSDVERREFDSWIDEEARLRKYAARIAQERPMIASQIAVASARKHMESATP